MTVQTTTTRADYNGNGLTTAFTVPFYFLDNTHLTVIRTQISTGVAATLALTTDYTVTGAGVAGGGTVTMVTAPTSDQRLSILRNVPFTQLVHYVPNDPFPAATHEQALDQLTMEVQQLGETAGRALTLPANSTGVSTTLPTPSANKLIGWNASANALQNVDQATLATIVAFGTANADVFTGTGAQTAFTLTANPGVQANLDVSVGGVTQIPGIDYTWSGGTTLIFSVAPPNGVKVLARYAQALPAGNTDSELVAYTSSGTGATQRTVQAKLRETISVLDFGAVGNGSTDDTTAIQNALNTAKRVIFPAGYTFLISGCQVPSNTHMVFETGCTVKLANSANRPAFQNTNWQKAGWGANTYGIDSNITVEGLYLDGNQANQAHTGTGTYAGEYTSGIRFFGVTNLRLVNVTIHYARTFGIWLAAINGLTTRDLSFDQYMGGTPDNQDGLHINGPAINLDIRNTRGTTNDDMIALNADDGALGSNVTAGAITNAIIDGVYPVGCLNGIRLLSATSRMDQIVVKNIVGSTRDVAVNQSPFGLGSGNVGTLTIENVDVQCSNGYAGGNYYSVITLDGAIDNVSVRGVKRNRAVDNRPSVLVTSSANIGVLEISGLTTFSTGTPPANEQNITVNGRVDALQISNLKWYRDASLTQAGASVLWINTNGSSTGLGVNNLICNDWIVERCRDAIAFTSGQLVNVMLSNINDYNGDSAYSLLNLNSSNAATTNVTMFNVQTTNGRKLVNKAGSSAYGSLVTIDNAGPSGASAGLPSNQSLPGVAYTKLNFNTLTFDRLGNEYSTGNQQFTVTRGPGVYLISYSIQLTVPTNPTDITLAIYKGGVAYRYVNSLRCFADSIISGEVAVVVAQGDVLDLRLYCSAATTAVAGNSTVVFYERLK